jgi:alkanesulfonate monooxygenase SsuD/methylene tetrahydromethanopterin reductase-like flavin-dependent oxidoreductase (luciferase family)
MAVQVMAAAPAHVGDLADARDRTRWFPALVSNHVVDLVNKYPREDLPEELTTYVRDREGYDYLHHAEVGSDNASFVSDEIVDRFCLVGSVDQHIERLRALADAGVDQFNLYLMNGDEERQLEIYGREIIPALRDVVANGG